MKSVLLFAAALAVLTPQEERGREIFRTGASPSEEKITAVLSDGAVEVPAATMPCANCHGPDGRGRPEGGVTPSDVTWQTLTKPYGANRPGGRSHPAYTERLLKRAVSLGIDPAGNPLHTAMPRYRMSHADMEDLIAYMKRLGAEPEPGVTEDTVRIGTLLPEGVHVLLGAYFEEVNRRGGIYGRKIELTAVPRDQVDKEPLFALLGADAGLAPLLEEKQIPAIGASGSGVSRNVFYLLSGLEEQTRALIARVDPGSELALVAVVDPAAAEAAAAARGLKIRSLRYTPGALDAGALVRDLRGADQLLFLGPGRDLARLLAAADAAGWRPQVFVPGSFAGADLFSLSRSFDRRVFLAFPTLPTDVSPAALAEYRALAQPAQVSALAAAKLLTEALTRTGRELTRDRLIDQLERLDRFETGLLPPLTYGPDRRVGARGAYGVTVDLEKKTFVPVGGWIAVE
ncbi:MAG TPA: ABC transporter substrate-binding protein [Thermoanaerobaculia bacterium]|nr:ABC transporter substrate-binding protein [Thermoanaerobaculia bacterium]